MRFVYREKLILCTLVVALGWIAWIFRCLLVLLFNPIALLATSDRAARIQGYMVTFKGISVWLYLPPSMRFRPRSLDAWVESKAPKAREKFEALTTVKEREVYVDLPVRVDYGSASNINPGDLKKPFAEPRTLIVVIGEGGAGKTSVACQIARWAFKPGESERFCENPILPVLLEGDIDQHVGQGGNVLAKAARGHLRNLLNEANVPSEHIVENLLKRKRVLLIIDGYSEMSDASRAAIRPLDPDFSTNALLVTSRAQDEFAVSTRTTIEPEGLSEDSLTTFIARYLERGKSSLLKGEKFFQLASDLQRLVGAQKVTPLFAKMYIDLFVSSKNGLGGVLPTTIPDLVLEYLNHLNRKITSEARKDDNEVHGLAKLVAYVCVGSTFRPSPARINAALGALRDDGREKEDLSYLEKRLRLIHTLPPGEEIRFSLDPLAEYLAAMRLIDRNQQSESAWGDFLRTVDGISGGATAVRGFLEAIAKCYVQRYPSGGHECFLLKEIDKRVDGVWHASEPGV